MATCLSHSSIPLVLAERCSPLAASLIFPCQMFGRPTMLSSTSLDLQARSRTLSRLGFISFIFHYWRGSSYSVIFPISVAFGNQLTRLWFPNHYHRNFYKLTPRWFRITAEFVTFANNLGTIMYSDISPYS